MSHSILVTGASGNIGKQLAAQLTTQGVAYNTLSSKPQGGDVRTGDYADVQSLARAFEGIHSVFIVLPLVPQKKEYAKNVALAARQAGVKHLVRASGAGADVNAGFALPRMQGEVDAILAESGAATTFLRNAGFMQNYAMFLAPMIKGGMFYAATNDAPQSIIDVRDIAAVAAKVLQAPSAHTNRAYTLTGGEALTDMQRVEILSRAIGRPVGYTAIPIEAASRTMKEEWHMPPVLVEWMDSLNTIVSAGYAAGVSPDVENILGRKPISFAQFAQDFAHVWK
jgi:uncharacterized protein YbjT (DUF2867 family)